jgi:hypothetical protein
MIHFCPFCKTKIEGTPAKLDCSGCGQPLMQMPTLFGPKRITYGVDKRELANRNAVVAPANPGPSGSAGTDTVAGGSASE